MRSLIAFLFCAALVSPQTMIVGRHRSVMAAGCSDVEKDTSGTIVTTGTSTIGQDSTTDYLHTAFKFVASSSYSATKITLNLRRNGTPAGTLRVWLVDANGANPAANGAAGSVASVEQYGQADLTTTFATYTVTLTSPKALSSGSTYYIKLTASQVEGATVYWAVERDTAAGAGQGVFRSANDSAWESVDADGEGFFRVIACE